MIGKVALHFIWGKSLMSDTSRVLGILLLVAATGQARAAQTVGFAPHRAIYDLSLAAASHDSSVDRARGRIAYEFTGNECAGFKLNFRQVTQMSDGEGKAQLSDVQTNTFESPEGTGFKFKTQTRTDQVISQQGEGKAERSTDGGVSVRIQRPKFQKLDLDGSAVFPTAHLHMLIDAASRGESFVTTKIFDGSDGGAKFFDTSAVIGREVPAGSQLRINPVLKQAGLDAVRRWPVTLSYFEPGKGEKTPIYVMSFDLYENGISGPVRFDFGAFAMKGALTKLDMLPLEACRK
jgi:hypothetical protein